LEARMFRDLVGWLGGVRGRGLELRWVDWNVMGVDVM